jgi:hypothetical protein
MTLTPLANVHIAKIWSKFRAIFVCYWLSLEWGARNRKVTFVYIIDEIVSPSGGGIDMHT